MGPRKIVLCLDGTWNSTHRAAERDDGTRVLKPSNVLKMARAVLPHNAAGDCEQLTYYDVGVGAQALYPGLSNLLLRTADSALGGAWGAGFESNVEEALRFLAYNHQPGDGVFIFGFSRGAATARAVTRFIDWAGGLPSKHDVYYLPILFRNYVVSRGQTPVSTFKDEIDARHREGGRESLRPFQDITVELLGVWDTVMSLGSRFRATQGTTSEERSFHVGPRPARCVRHARHAIAIDEKRYDFRPEIWRGRHDHQTLEQRWFVGVHSNVGGGYLDDGVANRPFHWFVDEAGRLGLELDKEFVAHYPPFVQDRLYSSQTVVYKVVETVRFRRGRGKRSLIGWPKEAHLELDHTVIDRLNADPARFREVDKPYRPDNVLRYLAEQPDLDAYLASLPGLEDGHRTLPDDVREKVAQMKA